MISDRQKSYRQVYRSRIMGFYDGYLHIAIIYAMGAAAFYIYLQHIENVTPLEWLTIPITFLFTNVFEWFVHKYVMHRPVNIKGLRAVYERHTLNHHQFFTDEEMRFRDHKDWRVTVFPPYALVVFILMSLPAGVDSRPPVLGQRRLAVHVHDDGHVPDLRVHALLLPRRRELVRAQHAVRQHAAPPSHRAPQCAADDGDQHEPDVPDRRLVLRHVGPESRPARPPVQRLRHATT